MGKSFTILLEDALIKFSIYAITNSTVYLLTVSCGTVAANLHKTPKAYPFRHPI